MTSILERPFVVPLDGPDCKAASSASQADKPNVWLRRSLCTVPARRMQAFPGPEREESRRGGARHIRICRQPGTLLEMSNLETNGARSEIGLERLNCIQCVRFFVGSPSVPLCAYAYDWCSKIRYLASKTCPALLTFRLS